MVRVAGCGAFLRSLRSRGVASLAARVYPPALSHEERAATWNNVFVGCKSMIALAASWCFSGLPIDTLEYGSSVRRTSGA